MYPNHWRESSICLSFTQIHTHTHERARSHANRSLFIAFLNDEIVTYISTMYVMRVYINAYVEVHLHKWFVYMKSGLFSLQISCHGISFNTMNHVQPTDILCIFEPVRPLHSSLNRLVITHYIILIFFSPHPLSSISYFVHFLSISIWFILFSDRAKN